MSDSKAANNPSGVSTDSAKPLRIALAGNPNSGKTTAFNYYTGSRQHVANYPGITVESKVGKFKFNDRKIEMVDLPGTYSLTAYSEDELVARMGLADSETECAIGVLNSCAIERNLYLAVQILELGLPLVLALNMYDETKAAGVTINSERLGDLLGVKAFPAIARTGIGLDETLQAAVDMAIEHRKSGHKNKPLEISYGPDLDPVIAELAEKIEAKAFLTDKYPARWVALKYLENDSEIRAIGDASNPRFSGEIIETVATVKAHIEKTLKTYPEALIADYRYGYIASLLKSPGVIERKDSLHARAATSDRIDRVLTHRFFGPIIMLAVIWLMYQITFTIGEIPMGWVEDFFGWLNETVSDAMEDGLLKSLVVSGMIDGVGAVMGFVPLILMMFLQISIMEDSGYMARIAYMLDRVFRAFGLHGYSVMPFIVSGGIAGGCAVPGVMACRTLRSPKEKLATILTLPYMTCGAKLPVFLVLVAVFFPDHKVEGMFILWLAGWVFALLVSLVLRKTIIKGESTPFVMELPPYRFPTIFGVILHTWERVWQYIKKAGTVILAISVIIWAMMTFPELPEDAAGKFETAIASIEEKIEAASDDEKEALEEQLAEIEAEQGGAALAHSIAGRLGKAIEPVTAPAGFEWRTNIALIGGIGAKEVIISTLGTAYSLGEVDPEEAESLESRIGNDPHWNAANASALMIFVLLYAPCFVTLAVIKQEAGSWKWALFSLIFNTLLAFVAAVIVYQVGLLIIA